MRIGSGRGIAGFGPARLPRRAGPPTQNCVRREPPWIGFSPPTNIGTEPIGRGVNPLPETPYPIPDPDPFTDRAPTEEELLELSRRVELLFAARYGKLAGSGMLSPEGLEKATDALHALPSLPSWALEARLGEIERLPLPARPKGRAPRRGPVQLRRPGHV